MWVKKKDTFCRNRNNIFFFSSYIFRLTPQKKRSDFAKTKKDSGKCVWICSFRFPFLLSFYSFPFLFFHSLFTLQLFSISTIMRCKVCSHPKKKSILFDHRKPDHLNCYSRKSKSIKAPANVQLFKDKKWEIHVLLYHSAHELLRVLYFPLFRRDYIITVLLFSYTPISKLIIDCFLSL